jgi:hypothetical protein
MGREVEWSGVEWLGMEFVDWTLRIVDWAGRIVVRLGIRRVK